MKKHLLSLFAAAVIAAGTFSAPVQTALGSASSVSQAASVVSAPTASRKSGTYTLSTGSMKVTLSSKDSGAKIYYSLNGASYKSYTKAITITKNSTLKTYAVKDGSKSSVKTFTYKLKPKVTVTPSKGEYESEQTVTISTGVSGVKFYYTLDGSKPTTSSTLYTAKGIKITETSRLRFMTVKGGWTRRYISLDYVIDNASADSSASFEMKSLLDDYTQKYGYSTLTSAQKKGYGRIFEAAAAHEETVDMSDLGLMVDDLETLYWAFDYDNPQFFWLDNGYGYGYNYSGQLLSVKMIYSRTKSEAEQISKEFDAATAEVLAEAAKYDSDYERLKVIHDWIVNKTSYITSGPSYKSEADGAIVYGKALCEGYSKAFMYLAQAAGIPTICVSGISNGGGHMWNMVQVGGQWYHVDVTWDDPVSTTPMLRYDYFMVGDKTIKTDHAFNNWIKMPTAPSDYLA